MKEIKQIFIIYILTFTVNSLYAQIGQLDIPSPSSIALAKYGDIPVSTYTGRANISIPIYSMEQAGVKLDINLSYDTSGILASSLPGWTGYGWTLNAGGVITRVVNGGCDEYDYDQFSYLTPSYHNYFQDPSKLKEWVDQYQTNHDMYELVERKLRHDNRSDNNQYDYNPDLFYFNFMGKTGRFFYGHDSQWHVASDENLKIEFSVTNKNNYIKPYFRSLSYRDENEGGGYDYLNLQMNTIKGFTIIDEDGTRYIFGDNSNKTEHASDGFENRANAIEYSMALMYAHRNYQVSSGGQALNATAWYLTEIQNRFGRTLYKFEYERGKFIVQINKVDERVQYNSHTPGTLGVTYMDIPGKNKFPYALSLNSPVYLKRILVPETNFKLDFVQSNNIELTSDDFYMDFYDFLYPARYSNYRELGYKVLQERFGDYPGTGNYLFPILQTDNKLILPYHSKSNVNKQYDPLRSMAICPLEEIIISQDDNVISSRKLEYTDGHKQRLLLTNIGIIDEKSIPVGKYNFAYFESEKLPKNLLELDTDYWGYYTDNTNKTPNLNYAKYGMLTQIKYPTGGITEIEYGSHKYSKVLSDDRQSFTEESGCAGGLRVESIKNYSDASKKELFNMKEYIYSEGELFAKPKLIWYWEAPNLIDGASLCLNFWRNNSIIPLCNSFGPHIGYSKVTEKYCDGSYKEYSYTNISSYKDDLPVISACTSPSPFDSFTERGYQRGKLLSEVLYSSSKELLSSTEYQYRSDKDKMEENFVYFSNLESGYAGNPSGNVSAQLCFYKGGIKKIFYPKYDIVDVKKTVKYGDQYITDYIHYDKRDYTIYAPDSRGVELRKCISMTENREGTNSITTQFDYPIVEVSRGVKFGGRRAPSIKKMSEEEKYCYNNSFYPCTKTTKKRNNKVITTNETIYGFKNDLYVPIEDKKSIADGNAYAYLTYDSYLSDGRLETFTELGNCQSKLFYDSRKRLVANVTCASGYGDMNYNEKIKMLSKNSKSVFLVPATKATVYSYNNKGMINSIASGNGNTQYYIYDTLGQLSEIRDNNNHVVKKFSNNVINK